MLKGVQNMRDTHKLLQGFLLPLVLLVGAGAALAQGDPMGKLQGKFIIFGDVTVTGAPEGKPLTLTVELIFRRGAILQRQTVGSRGRYQFTNVDQGDYEIVIEFENSEIYRDQVKLTGIDSRFRHDISLEWRSDPAAAKSAKPPTVSAEDAYDRKGPNKSRFEKAEEALDKKEYDKALALLNQVTAEDPQDFQAFAELGYVYLTQKNPAEAEKAYVRATEIRPTFFLALLSLGRLRLQQKSFEGAITALDRAVTVQPTSAEANYLLGNAYLQIKKGSKAVGYLNESLKLDPAGKADAHLLLAALYNGAGMKDKAAAEYEEFLKQKPDYAERKKLEAYIAANKSK
jgi:cytochrome c-type biogenesis protein CcmH/NrfG